MGEKSLYISPETSGPDQTKPDQTSSAIPSFKYRFKGGTPPSREMQPQQISSTMLPEAFSEVVLTLAQDPRRSTKLSPALPSPAEEITAAKHEPMCPNTAKS